MAQTASNALEAKRLHFDHVETISSPGDDINEDAYNLCDDLACVIDGASASTHRLIAGQSPAAWLGRALSKALAASIDQIEIREWLRQALEILRMWYFREIPKDDIMPRPSAAIAGVRLIGDTLSCISLGDVTTMMFGAPSYATTLLSGGHRPPIELDFQRRYTEMLEAGADALKARRTILRDIERRRLQRMNKEGGYWIASVEPEAAAHARVKSVKVAPGDVVLIASDGFLAAQYYGLIDNWQRLVTDGLSLRHLIDALRAVERNDPECVKFPRLKISDDATALLLKVGVG
jgi:serine/threonine protein phosphatase PrpC